MWPFPPTDPPTSPSCRGNLSTSLPFLLPSCRPCCARDRIWADTAPLSSHTYTAVQNHALSEGCKRHLISLNLGFWGCRRQNAIALETVLLARTVPLRLCPSAAIGVSPNTIFTVILSEHNAIGHRELRDRDVLGHSVNHSELMAPETSDFNVNAPLRREGTRVSLPARLLHHVV
jgi:hypothetical protein